MGGAQAAGSITDRSVAWPTMDELSRVLLLRDHNTRVVVLGTTLLGLAAGLVGSFTLLRKRALMGDALSHATLPGIGIAFIIGNAMGLAEKSLPLLLAGATVSGVLGVLAILFLRNFTRIKEDTALGVVLGVFFGAGVAVLGIVQQLGSGSAAGLQSFIYGKTASMVPQDVAFIACAGAAAAVACVLLFKEFRLLCFDSNYAAGQGWPVLGLDIAMMALVVTVTVVGLQAVGLILVIALLIIPAAAARFWTERMVQMVWIAAILGALSALFGAGISALFPRLPSGAMIVIVAAIVFALSMVFGSARGVLPRALRHRRLQRKVGLQNLLRAIYEINEAVAAERRPATTGALLRKRSWSPRELQRLVERAKSAGLAVNLAQDVRLTERGLADAARIVRNHRLWEMYLITHADVAPSHVDRDADMIEHVIDQELIEKLEALVEAERLRRNVPASPHPIEG
jgi:manganese/zinc/iron transport system permease protein